MSLKNQPLNIIMTLRKPEGDRSFLMPGQPHFLHSNGSGSDPKFHFYLCLAVYAQRTGHEYYHVYLSTFFSVRNQ